MFTVFEPSAASVLVDIAIVLVLLEMIYLFATSRSGSVSIKWMTVANSAAGLCLLLALRCAIHDSGPGLIMLAMTGALLAHLADLRLRYQVLPWGAGRDKKKTESARASQ